MIIKFIRYFKAKSLNHLILIFIIFGISGSLTLILSEPIINFIKMNEILELYFTILNPKIFVDMYSDDLNKLFDIDTLNLNFDYIKIPAVSNIIKIQRNVY